MSHKVSDSSGHQLSEGESSCEGKGQDGMGCSGVLWPVIGECSGCFRTTPMEYPLFSSISFGRASGI